MITFANFKTVIPSQILARGRSYQQNIVDLSFDEEDLFWEAQVEGSDLYDVRVELQDTGQLICSCTCPYDMGEYCKHVAAVLYAIEAAFPVLVSGGKRQKAVKRQTRHDKLRQQLEKASQEQLVSLLLDLAQQDRELLNQLLIRLDAKPAKPADYRRVVKDALRSGKGDHGYIDYTGSTRAARKLQELISQADQWRENGEVEKALGVYQAVLGETVSAIAHADDSNGELAGCISLSIEGLEVCARLLTGAAQEALFKYCLEQARQQDYSGWDWQWDMLYLAREMVDSSSRRALFTSALEDIGAKLKTPSNHSYYNQYGLERVALSQLALVDRFDGAEAALTFLKAHTHLNALRMELIERSIESGALAVAMREIQAGIEASEATRLYGLTNQYRALEVKLLQARGDTRAVRDAVRELWIKTGDEKHYVLLKKLVPAPEWPSYVERLISEVQRRPDQRAWLYAQEDRWDDLLKMVQLEPSAGMVLSVYQASLESRYPQEMARIYESFVDTMLVRARDRGDYRQIVGVLKQIRLLGQPERADVLAQEIRLKYANRPALLDELKKL